MKIYLHKSFAKDLRSADQKIKNAFRKRYKIFVKNQFDPCLKNHSLQGRWYRSRSINITGDVRAVYDEVGEDEVLFIALGTHSQLYG